MVSSARTTDPQPNPLAAFINTLRTQFFAQQVAKNPFVADTAAALAGPAAFKGTTERPHALGFVDRENPNTVFLTNTLRSAQPSDRLSQRVATHELGHVLSHQDSAARLKEEVQARFGELPFENYAAASRGEHFAEAFTTALFGLRVMQEHPKNISLLVERLDTDTPGVANMLSWLLDQEMFAEHPAQSARAEINQRILPALTQELERKKRDFAFMQELLHSGVFSGRQDIRQRQEQLKETIASLEQRVQEMQK